MYMYKHVSILLTILRNKTLGYNWYTSICSHVVAMLIFFYIISLLIKRLKPIGYEKVTAQSLEQEQQQAQERKSVRKTSGTCIYIMATVLCGVMYTEDFEY